VSWRWEIARRQVPSKESPAGHVSFTVDGEDSRSSGIMQRKFSDGLHAEGAALRASGPIGRR
jgi:hypothetical protein